MIMVIMGDRMSNFDKAGYGSNNIGIGEKCALLIVDFQNGFTDSSSQIGGSSHVNAAVDKTVELVKFASVDMPIASCRTSWSGPENVLLEGCTAFRRWVFPWA